MKQTIQEGRAEIDMWPSGTINITTYVHLPSEHALLEILEQVHFHCPLNCYEKDTCLGHCGGQEIISFVRRDIWIAD